MITSLWQKFANKLKGQAPTNTVVVLLVIIIILAILPMLSANTFNSNVSAATSYLESNGYVVFSEEEYALIAKEATAHAAVINAEAAVTAAQVAAAKVELFNSVEVFLFPEVTNVTITLTAGNTNAWSDWAQAIASTTENLSNKFITSAGYINDMYIYDHSAVDKVYCIELSYGASKTTLGRIMWHTSYKDTVQIKTRRVPAGETVYYRMMCSGANEATAKIGFRYFYE